MKTHLYALAALWLASGAAVAQPAGPSAPSSNTTTILAQAKQASGGDAWNGIRTLHIQSMTVSGGLTGSSDEWDDVRAGRYVTRYQLPLTSGADGFDGVSVWTQARGGHSYVLGDEDARQGAVNAAYQKSLAYWFPERGPATMEDAGPQREGGRTFDVLRLTPQAGRPFSMWIDQGTHLIDRFVEQQGEDVQIVRLLDYHTVEGVKLPFTVRTGDGDAQFDQVDTVQAVAINVPPAPDQFALPPPPVSDFRFRGGQTSTTVPFQLLDDKLMLPVRINGSGPFPAELDSGGNYILQPALAKKLGLTPQGSIKEGGGGEGFLTIGKVLVNSVDIGGLRLTDQVYKVFSLFKDAPEKTLVGLQIFQRFVVSINFDRQTLTLTRPDAFVYHGGGVVVPFYFHDNQPEVNGSVDGIAGVFTIDTGDDGSLLLIAPFAKRYGLVEQYGATIPYGGHAVGGATHGVMTRAGGLTLFGADGRGVVQVKTPLTRLSQQNAGFDADRYVSGNVGIGILKQFNLIFDYSRQQIIFEKNQNYGQKDVYNRSGLQLESHGPGWTVTNVAPGSPAAAAGLKMGDSVLTINGQDAAQLVAAKLYTLVRQEVGTKVTLVVQSGQSRRSLSLTLRDVL